MKLGIQIMPQFGFTMDEILAITETGLRHGFGYVWFSDHFMLDSDSTDRVLLDPWLAMTTLVCRNPWVHVGSLVFCNSYRHATNPALHAKMGATLDVLSEGRFEFGIGAGWKRIEYDAYGIPFPDSQTRISQLEEALQIIRGIWTEDKFSFAGSHYAVRNLVSFPKAVQKPHPTIWVGTMYGRRRMLEVAARFGDGINLAWAFSPDDLESVFAQVDEIRSQHRLDTPIKRSVGFWTNVFETQNEMEEALKKRAQSRGISLETARRQVEKALWGTAEEVSSKLGQYEDLGIDHAIFMFPHGEEEAQITRLGDTM
ncbi:MAG: LLM class flavin-dependent oxidoreductase [Candidatus Thorarchaeota archaeon]